MAVHGRAAVARCMAAALLALIVPSVAASESVLATSASEAARRLATPFFDADSAAALLRRQPVQLAIPRRADGGDGLEPVAEGLAYLEKLTVPLEVVAVVGGARTGKSTLANALMGGAGGAGGFPVSAGVGAHTRGLWTYGVPASPTDVDGDGDDAPMLLFLDVEGLSLTEAAAEYDSRLFAVSALAANRLLFNSVRTIDAASLEYLELLARRARLFHATAALGDAAALNGTAGLRQEDFRFPSLTWVVRDFAADEDRPTQWLRRLLGREHSPDAVGRSGVATTLSALFPDATAATLFLPATKAEQLRRVSDLLPDELTPEYRAGIADLQRQLLRAARAPPRRARLTGPQLAALLRVLLAAANEGKMAELPSLWSQFVDLQLAEARDAALAYFDSEVARHATQPPSPLQVLQSARAAAFDAGSKLFAGLTAGISGARVDEVKHELLSAMAERGEAAAEAQAAAIDGFLVETAGRLALDFADFASSQRIPQASANLSQALAAEESKVTEAFAEAAGRYGAHGAPHAASLRESVAQTRAARERDNAALLQQALESAQSAAVNAYADASRSLLRSLGNGRPLTTAELSTMHSKARALALRDFDTQAAIAAGEAGFGEVRAAAESQFARAEAERSNAESLDLYCQIVVDNQVAAAARAYGAVAYPADYDALEAIKVQQSTQGPKAYATELADFKDTEAFSSNMQELVSMLQELASAVDARQAETLAKIFHRDALLQNTELGRSVHPYHRELVVEGWLQREEVAALIGSVSNWMSYAAALAVGAFVMLLAQHRQAPPPAE